MGEIPNTPFDDPATLRDRLFFPSLRQAYLSGYFEALCDQGMEAPYIPAFEAEWTPRQASRDVPRD